MGVVAPVSGVGAVLVPVVVGVADRRAPGRARLGRDRCSRCPRSGWSPASRSTARSPVGSGLVDGVLAGLGFGTLFAALAQIPEEAGFLPLALNQVVAGVAIIVVATDAPLSPGCRATGPPSAASIRGALGALATGLFLVATQQRLPHGGGGHHLALPGLHGAARGDRAPRARAPRPGGRARRSAPCAVVLVATGMTPDAVVVGSGPNGLAGGGHPRPARALGHGARGARRDRRRHPDRRADRPGSPARHLLRGAPAGRGVAVPLLAAARRPRPGLALARGRPRAPVRRRDRGGAAPSTWTRPWPVSAPDGERWRARVRPARRRGTTTSRPT